VRVLLWHVHGSWTTAFVQGHHRYFLPLLPDRGPYGLGRARTWDWPASAVEVPVEDLARLDVDVVVVQRPVELECLVPSWLGRQPGIDVPTIYLEHDTPRGPVETMRHPAADREGITVVHVTWFNRLMWDTGTTPTRVIEHGVVDPGYRYRGDVSRAAVVINEPLRRGRVTGTDLLAEFDRSIGVDLFGMRSEPLGGVDLTQAALHRAMARRRLYLHTTRWTSLGLSLVEAMHLGMPVSVLGTTAAYEAVPPEAGVVSARVDVLVDAARRLLADRRLAERMGRAAREHALDRYGLKRFLHDWDELLTEAVG
jgi:glycosyltransferase involved in cell wall biosynthesis